MGKISYDRRVYQSVDDKSLSIGYISKIDKKPVSAGKGLIIM